MRKPIETALRTVEEIRMKKAFWLGGRINNSLAVWDTTQKKVKYDDFDLSNAREDYCLAADGFNLNWEFRGCYTKFFSLCDVRHVLHCKSDNDCPTNLTCTFLEALSEESTPIVRKCDCIKGFYVEALLCIDINECEWQTHDCVKGSNCVNTIGSFYCECSYPKFGDGKIECFESQGMQFNSSDYFLTDDQWVSCFKAKDR